jgi:prepilin-type N-terminal cleavage/methylation domain-containing protein
MQDKTLMSKRDKRKNVIPAKAGIQSILKKLDSRFYGNDDQKGLTLVEVLIASLIVLILFLALMQSVLLSINMNLKNQMRDEAVNIAEERMRELRSLDFTDSTTADELKEANNGREATAVTRGFRDFTIPFTITRTIADLGTDVKSITVSVSYRDVKDINYCSVSVSTECTADAGCPSVETCGPTQTISSILRKDD